MIEPNAPPRIEHELHEACEVLAGSAHAPVFVTCEHASASFFSPWELVGGDARLEGTHWASDPGAAEIVRELGARIDAPAVLARFSRLIIDPNRPLDAPTLFRDVADGAPVALNAVVTPEDRNVRVARFWEPYHATVDRVLGLSRAPIVFPVHTFTDEYEGSRRDMEIGVLFDEDESLAAQLRDCLADAGFVVAMNEPWSGKDGLIYSGERHARTHGRRVVELEARQDCATSPVWRARLVPVLAAFFTESQIARRADDAPA